MEYITNKMSNRGTLLKITPTKKLMIEIDQTTFERLTRVMQAIAAKRGFSSPRLATWEYTDDNGVAQYRISVKLDKYDVQNLRKFEALLGSAIGFSGTCKPYDFIPEGQSERMCGVNYELLAIFKRKPVELEKTELTEIEKQMAELERAEASDE